MGNTKIDKNSKIMLATDGKGLNIGLVFTKGMPHEVNLAQETLESICMQ